MPHRAMENLFLRSAVAFFIPSFHDGLMKGMEFIIDWHDPVTQAKSTNSDFYTKTLCTTLLTLVSKLFLPGNVKISSKESFAFNYHPLIYYDTSLSSFNTVSHFSCAFTVRVGVWQLVMAFATHAITHFSAVHDRPHSVWDVT